MLNEAYKRENHKSYLVIKGDTLSRQMDYDMKMLCENPLENILSMSVHVFNGEKELYYDISSKQSFEVMYEQKMLYKEDLEILFSDLQKALKQLEEYLLEPECLMPDPSYIYIGNSDHRASFLCAPVLDKNYEARVYDFAEYILEKICNEDEEAVMYAYSFYRYIKEEKGDLTVALDRMFATRKESEVIVDESVEPEEETGLAIDICGVSEEEKSSGEEETRYIKVMRTSFFSVLGLAGLGMMIYSVWKYQLSFSTLFSEAESIVGAGICAIAMGGILLFYLLDRYANQEEESSLDIISPATMPEEESEEIFQLQPEPMPKEDYATILLQENCYSEQRILTGRVKGRKRQIDLSAFPFLVGKSKEQVDYVLDDTSISRVHARFTLREDVVYLTDLNSTNGTKRNGVLLEPNELVMLETDDEITFGRLTFTYH
ncbi:MAG: FHA domain-containing protein [Lachnospiraceae bacterium]|nr:FHA domain-containing protein [Lachnospiraceae bacterium]